jgi:hypothetical protein
LPLAFLAQLALSFGDWAFRPFGIKLAHLSVKLFELAHVGTSWCARRGGLHALTQVSA